MSTRINTTVTPPNLSNVAVANVSGGSILITGAITPQPVTMMLHGRQPPVGDTFRPDQPLFPSSLAIGDNRYLHYHVIVWTKLFGQDVTDYGCVYANGDGLRLCFNSRASLQKFERWWKRYNSVFFQGSEISEGYCPFPKTGKLNGYYVEDAPTPAFGTLGGGGFYISGVSGQTGNQGPTGPVGVKVGSPYTVDDRSRETISEVFLPDWVMIVRHSTRRVIRMNNGWFFTSAKDGIMFKMQQT